MLRALLHLLGKLYACAWHAAGFSSIFSLQKRHDTDDLIDDRDAFLWEITLISN